MSESDAGARGFSTILDEELDSIAQSRELRGQGKASFTGETPRERAKDAGLVGLAFSGGGIRSATLNLGIAQGLARLGLLRRFDYLSTSSGGGYVGGFLEAWIKRRGIDEVERELAASKDEGDTPQSATTPVHFLRRFSNYLTPKVGVLTADTWTIVATYLRNLLLNLITLATALAAALLVPRLVVDLSDLFRPQGTAGPVPALTLGLVALAVSIVFVGLNTRPISRDGFRRPSWYKSQLGVQLTVVLPLFLSAWLLSAWLWFSDVGSGRAMSQWLGETWQWFGSRAGQGSHEPLLWILAGLLLYTLLWCTGTVVRLLFKTPGLGQEEKARRNRLWRALVLSAPIAGGVGGGLTWALTWIFRTLRGALAVDGGPSSPEWPVLHVIVWGAPLLTVVFTLTAVIQIGLMGRAFGEGDRQWWSRLGAWLLIYGITWCAGFGLAVYGPMVLVAIGVWFCGGLSAGWAGSTLGGLLAGRKTEASGDPSPLRRLLTTLAPQIFVVGLLALLALGIHAGLAPRTVGTGDNCEGFFWPQAADLTEPKRVVLQRIVTCHSERFFDSIDGTTWGLALLLFTLALALSWRIDINQFSMHLLYRSRLIRAFLGASHRRRHAQPFTGFDPLDDVPLSTLRPDAAGERPYSGPYPIINTALNLVAGDELAWQQRKASCFIFTPRYSGFDLPGQHEEEVTLSAQSYRPTAGYDDAGGISLGTAVAISGAAVSPNQGYQTTPAMAFLLTVFNVRLGWWLGNPRHKKTWHRMGPTIALFTLFAELFGMTDDRSRYVYLSDGGHFDNTGLYELLRRRCRFIVLGDGSGDPERDFTDLGNAVRKARTDFGIDIELNVTPLKLLEDGRQSQRHCAIGIIRYSQVDPETPDGILLYLKSSLANDDESADIVNYAATSELFPHEPTADQWFDESQFESYRKLGIHIAQIAFGPVADQLDASNLELFAALQDAWPASEGEGPPSREA